MSDDQEGALILFLLLKENEDLGITFSGMPVPSWQCDYCQVTVYERDDAAVRGSNFPHNKKTCLLKRAWDWMERE